MEVEQVAGGVKMAAFATLCKFFIRKLVLNKRGFVILLSVCLLFGIILLRLNREVSEAEHMIAEHHSSNSHRGTTTQQVSHGRQRPSPAVSQHQALSSEADWRHQPKLNHSPIASVRVAAPEPGEERRPALEGSSECVFSSHPPSLRPTVHMPAVMDRLAFDNPNGGVWKQGFDITYDETSFRERPLQVVIVPHSHNDPGWLYTFEEYYAKQTRAVLNNMVKALQQDASRKFIYAEVSFLDLWWREQSPEQRSLLHRLIKAGQFEVVTGGWVMNDEATTHYYAMLDQLMEGHWWLQDNLPGVKPRSGWAIDPFGHTPTMAYLLKGMGLENMLIQRVHYSVKKELAAQRQLEFFWRQEWDHHGNTDMFCHMMPFYSYDIPHTCGPDPKICCQFDFKRLPSLSLRVSCPWRVAPETITPGNVAQKARVLLDQYRKKAQLFRTNVLLVPLGDDFRYDNWREVEEQYANYGRLLDYMNAQPDLNVKAQIGTLSDYFDALRKSPETEPDLGDFPVLAGDFYTYSDRDDHYWSGYYTSRPFYKRFDRILETNLRSADVLFSLGVARGWEPSAQLYQRLVEARRSLGLFQHHDGITGTAREKVVVDYGQKVLRAIHNSQEVMISLIQSLLLKGTSPGTDYFDVAVQQSSHNTLPTPTHIALDTTRNVVVYNSLASKRLQLVRLEIDTVLVSVLNANGEPVACQINPIWTSDTSFASDRFELVFAVAMEGISLESYQLAQSTSVACFLAEVGLSGLGRLSHAPSEEAMRRAHGISFKVAVETQPGAITMTTVAMEAVFDGRTGLLTSLSSNGVGVSVGVDFAMYGVKSSTKERSGAYLFLPDGPAVSVVGQGQLPVRTVSGELVKEVHSTPKAGLAHRTILENIPGASGRSVVVINDVNIQQDSNKELAMRVRSGVENTHNTFFSDLNGFQLVQRRTRDKLPLQANYYPVPSMLLLQDRARRLSLLSAQPLGGASLEPGWLEVMLDRRLMQDDNRGLGQPVKDNLPTRSIFRLLLEPLQGAPPPAEDSTVAYPSLLAHASSMEVLHPFQTFVAKTTMPANVQTAASRLQLTPPLPCDLHMVTLRTHLQNDTPLTALVLHRKGFSCSHGNFIDCELSEGKVNLEQLLGNQLKQVFQTSLTTLHKGEPLESYSVEVGPMEMKTFSIQF